MNKKEMEQKLEKLQGLVDWHKEVLREREREINNIKKVIKIILKEVDKKELKDFLRLY